MSDAFLTITPREQVDCYNDVVAFFHALADADLNFHPDTPFTEYGERHRNLDARGGPVESMNIGTRDYRWYRTFTDHEAEILQYALDNCRDICRIRGVDIYGLACDIWRERFPNAS